MDWHLILSIAIGVAFGFAVIVASLFAMLGLVSGAVALRARAGPSGALGWVFVLACFVLVMAMIWHKGDGQKELAYCDNDPTIAHCVER